MHPFLSVQNLSLSFGKTQVLSGINLEVAQGKFTALLGASGCGKTTLLRAVAGFNQPQVGSIFLKNQEITNLAPEKRNMAMVFQSYALWPHMSVFQNLAFGLKLKGLTRNEIQQKIEKMLDTLHLNNLADRKVPQLSGGQRQRVALGRALIGDPSLLLLDEPLSNLDARIRLSLRKEIKETQQQFQITTIHVTHDREEAMSMADQVVIMNQGKVAQQGSPEEVYHFPNSPFTAAFMGAENSIELQAISAENQVVLQIADSSFHLPREQINMPHAVNGEGILRFRSEDAGLFPANHNTSTGVAVLGEIQSVFFLGGSYQFAVHCGQSVYSVHATEKWEVGESVRIVLPPQSIHLYPKTLKN